MSAETFFDTHVLVYHLDTTDKRKHKVAVAMEPAQARQYLDLVLLPLMKVGASPALYQRALDVQARWRFSFYDSLIAAAALSAGCTRLLTEDLQVGQRIESLTVQKPVPALKGI